MSLPEQAGWFYNYIPMPGSAENQTLDLLKKGIDWI
jgi:coproporphyrinogen III oxidase